MLCKCKSVHWSLSRAFLRKRPSGSSRVRRRQHVHGPRVQVSTSFSHPTATSHLHAARHCLLRSTNLRDHFERYAAQGLDHLHLVRTHCLQGQHSNASCSSSSKRIYLRASFSCIAASSARRCSSSSAVSRCSCASCAARSSVRRRTTLYRCSAVLLVTRSTTSLFVTQENSLQHQRARRAVVRAFVAALHHHGALQR